MKQKNVLIHGYMKNSKDMMVLKAHLDQLGYENILVDLPLTFKKLDYCNSKFLEIISDIASGLNTEEKLNLIGHSTGGLLIRYFLATAQDISFINRCVLIATPNKGSELADMAGRLSTIFIRLFRTLESLQTKEVLKIQPNNSNGNVEIGCIAGNKCNLFLGYLLSEENDGRVTVNSAKLEGLRDFIVLPYGHKEIHYKFITAKLIDSFLKNSRFEMM